MLAVKMSVYDRQQLHHTDLARPWSCLPCEGDPSTLTFFHASILCVVGDGSMFFFCTNPWIEGQCITSFTPGLVVAVPRRFRRQWTVAAALPDDAWIRDVTGPLTVPIIVQYLTLQ
jgi:hypothetical protein